MAKETKTSKKTKEEAKLLKSSETKKLPASEAKKLPNKESKKAAGQQNQSQEKSNTLIKLKIRKTLCC